MTAGALIAQVDALRPNQYTAAEKLRWLQLLDGQVKLLLLDSHQDERAVEGAGPYGEETDSSTQDERAVEGAGPYGEGTDSSTVGGDAPAAADAAEAAYTEDTELLCPAPWDEELYTFFLFCRIDLMNAEIDKYDQSAALFAAAWRQYADAINRARPARGERRWKL